MPADDLIDDHLIDTDRYPLHDTDGQRYRELVAASRAQLASDGLVDLPGFLRDEPRMDDLARLLPMFDSVAYAHARDHTIYFSDTVDGLEPTDGALVQLRTSNRTLCGDDLAGTAVDRVYRWPPLRRFVADICSLRDLHLLADPLACLNAMAYGDGEALGWHFDRAGFTTTLLLQRPMVGGQFTYRKDLRTDADPNHDGVARLLAGDDPEVRVVDPAPGTLTVFGGQHTPHCISPVEGDQLRVIVVLAFAGGADVSFSDEDRRGFYGRHEPRQPG